MSWTKIAAALLVIIGIVSVPAATAQTAAGEANGTVTDRSGGVVPGATVTLTNQGTKISRTAVTNASGNFVFVNVQPGIYVLKVELTGFKTVEVPPFDIGVNQARTHAIALEVGAMAENVTVVGEAPMLQVTSTELGTVIPEKVVHDLPLNGRNFTQLLTLTPGATPISTAQGSGVSFQDAGMTGIPGSSFAKPSLHGQQNRSTLYFLDGILNTDLRGPVYGVLPIVDLMQEFKVQSHNEKTEYGGVVGGVVNIVSKSGTNTQHGSGWEFLRNNTFDARDPFKDATSSKPAPFRQNEFGGSFGGPIIRNRTFFYAGYEGWRYRKPSQAFGLVATDAELNGDFTQSVLRNDIYNPFSTRPDPSRPGQYLRDRFMCDAAGNPLAPLANLSQPAGTPCNRIPAGLISPAMQGFLRTYMATPNYAGAPGQNYIENRATTDNSDSWQIKVDHRFTDNDSAFFRLSQMWVDHLDALNGTLSTQPSVYHAYNYGGGWDHVFRSNLMIDVRAGGLAKPYVFNQSQAAAGIDPMKKLGFRDIDRFQGMVVTLAAPWITGDIGNRGDSPRDNPNWSIGGSATWFRGNHNIKAGAQYIRVERLQINRFQTFGFSNTITGNPQSAGTTGSSLASALLGLPGSYSGQLPDLGEVHFQLATWSVYVQDEWRVKPHVTFNWGLRYDVLTQPSSLNNRLSNALDLDNQLFLIGASSIPACSQTQQNPCFPGAGLASVPYADHIRLTGSRAFMPKPVYDNIGPRAGGAWEITPRTVLRAGYALMWDPLPARSQYVQNDIEAASWPWTTAFSGVANNVVGNPVQSINTIEGAFPVPVPAASPWSTGGYYDDPNFKDAYSHQWNVEVQRQLTSTTMFSVAYVGSKNGRLPYTGYGNAARTASPNGTPLATVDTLRPMPFMIGSLRYSRSIGKSRYNALQTKFERRLSGGLHTLVSYTWSRSMDNSSGWFAAENGPGGGSAVQNFFDPDSNYSVSSYDIPHFLSWSTVCDLPFGEGKRWLQSGPLSWIAGGWQVNSILQVRSGQPYNLVVNGDVANISGTGSTVSGYARPNLIGNPIPAQQTADMWYDPSAFAVPVGSFGNFGRNVLRSSRVINVDLSAFRDIRVGASRHLQLRVEAFNVFNIQNLGVPATTIGQAGAGRITSIVGTPRQVQLGIRFVF